jgi:hypothetical protein
MKRADSTAWVFTAAVFAAPAVMAQTPPSDLIVSGTTYQDVGQAATLVAGKSLLAPANAGGPGTVATGNGQYQNVFLNTGPDASFGVTSQIFLQNYSSGTTVNIDPGALVGSFSSKSELALNLSSDGRSLTFSGYVPTQSFSSSGSGGVAAVTPGGSNNLGLLDISNSNTQAVIDSTNPVNAQAYRSVAQVNLASLFSAANGANLGTGTGFTVTNTNAYSGNNGRAVLDINGQYYMAGNAGNGSKSGPVVALAQNTGVQTIAAGATNPNTTVVGQCSGPTSGGSGYQCGFNNGAADKTGKDNNFRGLTSQNGNLYVSKGSGSNGVDTVYQVSGIGNPATATVSILPGFPTSGTTATPFGLWFANSTTLYVASEGSDSIASAAGNPTPGLGGITKYSLSAATGKWVADYTISTGLGSFTAGAVGADKGSTTFYTDGLRNLTGELDPNGTVRLFAVTATLTDSTAGSAWDQGANPDQVVELTDNVNSTTAANGEAFTALETSSEGSVYRGVALAPVPLPASLLLFFSGLGGVGFLGRKRSA